MVSGKIESFVGVGFAISPVGAGSPTITAYKQQNYKPAPAQRQIPIN